MEPARLSFTFFHDAVEHLQTPLLAASLDPRPSTGTLHVRIFHGLRAYPFVRSALARARHDLPGTWQGGPTGATQTDAREERP